MFVNVNLLWSSAQIQGAGKGCIAVILTCTYRTVSWHRYHVNGAGRTSPSSIRRCV